MIYLIKLQKYILNFLLIKEKYNIYWGLGIGDWGLGIGVWGLGAKPQTPKPQTPNPKPQFFWVFNI